MCVVSVPWLVPLPVPSGTLLRTWIRCGITQVGRAPVSLVPSECVAVNVLFPVVVLEFAVVLGFMIINV